MLRGAVASRRVAGGDINDAWQVELEDGTRAFVKTRADAVPGEYATEAAALRWLGEVDGAPLVPEVLAVDAYLALAWVDTGTLDAAYGGHREVDLAMLALFGAPSPRTLAAYDEVLPRAPGHAARLPLWQLLPLLVHAVLFGGGYGASAVAAARRAAP